MNRIVQKKSRFIVLFIYCCAIALFADGSNLTDLFSDVSTLHFEEGDGTDLANGSNVLAAVSVPSLDLFKSLKPTCVGGQRPAVIKRVILDQDSPSLEPVPISYATTIIPSPDEKEFSVHRIFLSESLYLQYCSLLI